MNDEVWHSDIGIETTWLPPGLSGDYREYEITSRRLNEYSDDLDRNLMTKVNSGLRRRKIDNDGPHWDDGCVEIPSMILKSFEEAMDWYDKLYRLMVEKLGFTTRSRWCGTGGGHIHLNCKSRDHAHKVFVDYANRPYLTWMFADPCDDWNAVSPWSRVNPWMLKKLKSVQESKVCPKLRDLRGLDPIGCTLVRGYFPGKNDLKHVDLQKYWPNSKNGGVRSCGGGDEPHLEFRFFRAPKDREEQIKQIRFTQHYLKWVDENPQAEVIIRNHRQMRAYTVKKAEGEFKQLIKDLGLAWKDYKPYVKNMQERIEVYGKSHLN